MMNNQLGSATSCNVHPSMMVVSANASTIKNAVNRGQAWFGLSGFKHVVEGTGLNMNGLPR